MTGGRGIQRRAKRPMEPARPVRATHADVIAAADAWDAAMVTNDVEAIGAFMTPDWILIGVDGRETDRTSFLAQVASGELTHDVMQSPNALVRIYGDLAVMTTTGVSGGTYQGQRFLVRERVACVFRLRDGRWMCALTRLSSIEEG